MPDHITWWEPYRESVREQLVVFRSALREWRFWRWVLVVSLLINIGMGIWFTLSWGPGSIVWWHHLIAMVVLPLIIVLQFFIRIFTVPRRIVLYHGGLHIWHGGKSNRFLRERILWMAVREPPGGCARLVVVAMRKQGGPGILEIIIGRTTDLEAVRAMAATFRAPDEDDEETSSGS